MGQAKFKNKFVWNIFKILGVFLLIFCISFSIDKSNCVYGLNKVFTMNVTGTSAKDIAGYVLLSAGASEISKEKYKDALEENTDINNTTIEGMTVNWWMVGDLSDKSFFEWPEDNTHYRSNLVLFHGLLNSDSDYTTNLGSDYNNNKPTANKIDSITNKTEISVKDIVYANYIKTTTGNGTNYTVYKFTVDQLTQILGNLNADKSKTNYIRFSNVNIDKRKVSSSDNWATLTYTNGESAIKIDSAYKHYNLQAYNYEYESGEDSYLNEYDNIMVIPAVCAPKSKVKVRFWVNKYIDSTKSYKFMSMEDYKNKYNDTNFPIGNYVDEISNEGNPSESKTYNFLEQIASGSLIFNMEKFKQVEYNTESQYNNDTKFNDVNTVSSKSSITLCSNGEQKFYVIDVVYTESKPIVVTYNEPEQTLSLDGDISYTKTSTNCNNESNYNNEVLYVPSGESFTANINSSMVYGSITQSGKIPVWSEWSTISLSSFNRANKPTNVSSSVEGSNENLKYTFTYGSAIIKENYEGDTTIYKKVVDWSATKWEKTSTYPDSYTITTSDKIYTSQYGASSSESAVRYKVSIKWDSRWSYDKQLKNSFEYSSFKRNNTVVGSDDENTYFISKDKKTQYYVTADLKVYSKDVTISYYKWTPKVTCFSKKITKSRYIIYGYDLNIADYAELVNVNENLPFIKYILSSVIDSSAKITLDTKKDNYIKELIVNYILNYYTKYELNDESLKQSIDDINEKFKLTYNVVFSKTYGIDKYKHNGERPVKSNVYYRQYKLSFDNYDVTKLQTFDTNTFGSSNNGGSKTNNFTSKETNATKLNISTPLDVSHAELESDKNFVNQTDVNDTIALKKGEIIDININHSTSDSTIFGNLDTSKYAKEYKYVLDFDVEYNGITYKAGTYITVPANKNGGSLKKAKVLSDVTKYENGFKVMGTTYNEPSYKKYYDFVRSGVVEDEMSTTEYSVSQGSSRSASGYIQYIDKNYINLINLNTCGQEIDMGNGIYSKNDSYYNVVYRKTYKNPPRIYGFRITDCLDIDYKNSFRDEGDASKLLKTIYYSGTKSVESNGNNNYSELNKDTVNNETQNNVRIIPLGPYKSIKQDYIYAPKLGYRFSFDLTTAGYYSNKREVKITPSYYYISKDGKTFIDNVVLYYMDSSGKYINLSSSTAAPYTIYFNPDDEYRNKHIGIKYYSSISWATLLDKLVPINVNKEFTLTTGYYEENYLKYYQYWYGEYKLPNSTIAFKDANSTSYENRLTDGYIGVRFDIKSIDTDSSGKKEFNISYNTPDKNNNSKDNTTQWDYEGFLGFNSVGSKVSNSKKLELKLENGTWKIDNDTYQKIKGTVILYDTDRRAADDFN